MLTKKLPVTVSVNFYGQNDKLGHTSIWGAYPLPFPDGPKRSPGETTIVFAKGQTYKKISPRKIQPADAWLSATTLKIAHKLTGKPCGLGKGQGDLPVDCSVV